MFFEIFATVIFFVAVLHIFIANVFLKKKTPLAFLGNVTLIFGLWLIPILIAAAILDSPAMSLNLLHRVDFQEPFAYFVLITVATIRPIHNLFDALMQKMNHLFKNQLLFFWLGILIISSLLTGIFSEIAIMVLACWHLSTAFFSLKPSPKLTYCTLALLLIGLSVGTTIIPFNFSFFLNVVNGNWSHLEIFRLFGWQTLFALLCICIAVGYYFRKEFSKLQKNFAKRPKRHKITLREVFYALLFFLASFGKENVYVLLMVLALVIILHKAFYRIKGEEGKLRLYFPIAVAFFTYTLEIHAGLQKWWVLPLFENAKGIAAYPLAFFLTGLNEHVPLTALKDTLRTAASSTQFFTYLGILAGGGLTIIAKSANIVAKLKLRQHFPHRAISPFLHLFIAIPLGLIFSAIVALLHYLGAS